MSQIMDAGNLIGKPGANYIRETFPRGTLDSSRIGGTSVSFVRTTPTQRLADLLLPTTLSAFVQERRDVGRSWRLIARDLHEQTGGQIDVTAETLRGWFGSERAA